MMVFVHNIWASIQAIEGNLNDNNRKWLTFWVLFAMAMLFEYISEPLIKWIQFWLEMKLVVTFCLVAPRLNGAVYVYEAFIRLCFHLNPQTCSTWFNTPKKTFLLGSLDDFLLVADRYVKENGSEVLDNLITEKVMRTETNLPLNQIREITTIEENKVMAAQSKVSPGSLAIKCTQASLPLAESQSLPAKLESKVLLRGKKHLKKEAEIKANTMVAKRKGGRVSKSKQTYQPIGTSENVGSKKQASLWYHNCNVRCSGLDMINHLSGYIFTVLIGKMTAKCIVGGCGSYGKVELRYGEGKVHWKGVAYYNRLIEYLFEKGAHIFKPLSCHFSSIKALSLGPKHIFILI
ncbi:hypothetical protein GIB67_031539 [Kingdonia uniflora]|uniref:HVA22-like protein n=1 Tax=Kingdonia uniflora TaxID=39325 RepID=A0A7J7PC09_9MAGN|nr:hypothetical protein GIB67_031539 [Kingdonia uniflora]